MFQIYGDREASFMKCIIYRLMCANSDETKNVAQCEVCLLQTLPELI